MAIRSMTGFASVHGQTASYTWVWEVRSVNGKGLDARFRLPSFLAVLEDEIRKAVRAKFHRGNLQINLALERDPDETTQVHLNTGLMRALIAQSQPLVDEGLLAPPSLDGLLGVRGVVETHVPAQNSDELYEPLLASFNELLAVLAQARAEEGQVTQIGLLDALARIEERVAQARENPALQPKAIHQRLLEQAMMLGETIAADRLAQEVALLAIKADVNEELERLSSHIGAARALLQSSGAVGRKLEFLAQEFNREVNTLCAKSANQQLTDTGLELKTLVDQIKEQAANVE